MRTCTDKRHNPDNPCDYDECAACQAECTPPPSLTDTECRKLQADLRQLLGTDDVDISVEDQCVVLPVACMQQLLEDLGYGR